MSESLLVQCCKKLAAHYALLLYRHYLPFMSYRPDFNGGIVQNFTDYTVSVCSTEKSTYLHMILGLTH